MNKKPSFKRNMITFVAVLIIVVMVLGMVLPAVMARGAEITTNNTTAGFTTQINNTKIY